jgi:hypothetical protein
MKSKGKYRRSNPTATEKSSYRELRLYPLVTNKLQFQKILPHSLICLFDTQHPNRISVTLPHSSYCQLSGLLLTCTSLLPASRKHLPDFGPFRHIVNQRYLRLGPNSYSRYLTTLMLINDFFWQTSISMHKLFYAHETVLLCFRLSFPMELKISLFPLYPVLF